MHLHIWACSSTARILNPFPANEATLLYNAIIAAQTIIWFVTSCELANDDEQVTQLELKRLTIIYTIIVVVII